MRSESWVCELGADRLHSVLSGLKSEMLEQSWIDPVSEHGFSSIEKSERKMERSGDAIRYQSRTGLSLTRSNWKREGSFVFVKTANCRCRSQNFLSTTKWPATILPYFTHNAWWLDFFTYFTHMAWLTSLLYFTHKAMTSYFTHKAWLTPSLHT